MSSEKKDYKALYKEALKRIEALERQLKLKGIELKYEEKGEIALLLEHLFGNRPSFGGGSVLRWELSRKLVTALYQEQEGDFHRFMRRFSRHNGITLRTLRVRYLNPLIDEGIIEVFAGENSEKWRWKAKVKPK